MTRALDFLEESARRQERRGEVRRQRRLPAIEREAPERHVFLGPDPSDGDACVEAAERRARLLEEPVSLVLPGQVGLGEHGALAALGGHGLGPVAPAVVVDDDAGALGREGARAGGADAARGARDEHALAGEPCVHGGQCWQARPEFSTQDRGRCGSLDAERRRGSARGNRADDHGLTAATLGAATCATRAAASARPRGSPRRRAEPAARPAREHDE